MTFHALLGVMSAVILGLAVVKVLQGILWMIHDRGQIKVYWVHLVWVAVLIFGPFLHFWNIVKQRNITGDVNIYGIADMLWLPMLFYILAGLLFPPSAEDHSGDDRPVDLRDFYYENRAWIFGAFAIVIVTNAGFLGSIVNQPFEARMILSYVLVLMFGALAVIRNEGYHMVNAIIFPLVIILSLLLN